MLISFIINDYQWFLVIINDYQWLTTFNNGILGI